MNRVERAKLFIPFDALKGLQDILREKEKEVEQRKELSEESLMMLQEELNKVEIGSRVKIKYYNSDKYIEVSGIVKKLLYSKKKIIINENLAINLSDIIELKVN